MAIPKKKKSRLGEGSHGGGGGHDAAGGLRWLLTYADMITLLLALFIYFYSVSVVSDTKVAEFSEAMASQFGLFEGTDQPMPGGRGMLPSNPALPSAAVTGDPKMDRELEKLKQAGFQPERAENRLKLVILDQLLFEPGKLDVSTEGRQALANLAHFLNHVVPTYPAQIVGHTDNVEVDLPPPVASNWELSTLRAGRVAATLTADFSVNPRQIHPGGQGSHFPVAGTSLQQTEVERARNRRVEVIIELNPNPEERP